VPHLRLVHTALMRSLSINAPAKVNLFLGVGAIRPDGYHSVETVLHTLELSDTVSLSPADALTLSCDPNVGVPAEDNLAYRAAQEFARQFEIEVLLDIRVVKRIPWGAGLGGGSSDAAAVLVGLAYWAGLPLEDERLLSVARLLGADVPFLLAGGAAHMDGRGDQLVQRAEPFEAPVVLVKPAAVVPTAAAYAAFDAAPRPSGDSRGVLDALRSQDAALLGAALANNMTDASCQLVPQIGEAISWLHAENDVLGVAMAGSGSAVFALCAEPCTTQRLAEEASQRGWWATATRLNPHGASITLGDEFA
jgi:4-diphosphocytidyl-2-C-methyl-D-erythritol kinase